MMRADGHQVPTSTVQRALRRRGLLLPTGFRADRRSWARLRKRVFRDPPRQRNRVWQMGFSGFGTARGGIWRICAVIGYAAKYCLAATVTPASRGQDALGCLHRAVAGAERVPDNGGLRAGLGAMDAGGAGDYVIGEAPAPIAVVTDNRPCFRGVTFAGDDPLFRHVRTRARSPQHSNDDEGWVCGLCGSSPVSGAKVQVKCLVNSADPGSKAWVNEHLVRSLPRVQWYALVIIEGFKVSGVAAFPPMLGAVCHALRMVTARSCLARPS